MDEAEFVERYMILLIGIEDKPVPSDLHLQKEIFLLSKFKESLAKSFDFNKHYFGPYSQVLDEALKNPAYFPTAFDFNEKNISLTKSGKDEFSKMKKDFAKENDFQIILSSVKLLRTLYDKLTYDELLLLIYETYPEYTEFSQVSDRILKNDNVRFRLIENIFSKGLITKERYEELRNAR